MAGRNRLARLLAASILWVVCLLAACDRYNILADDFSIAKEAYMERNLSLCERLLERYLREEQNPDKRWQAWDLLLKALNGHNLEARASLECLESMLEEFEGNEAREAEILAQMGLYNKILGHYKRAEDCWSAYVDLAVLTPVQRVEGYRNLAAMQLRQRHFTAAEESLQQCLALPVSDHDKISCMLDLADANFAMEQWQVVADLCQQILDSNPDDKNYALAGFLRADALEQLGQKKAALAQFELAKPVYPNPAVVDNRIAYLKKLLKQQ